MGANASRGDLAAGTSSPLGGLIISRERLLERAQEVGVSVEDGDVDLLVKKLGTSVTKASGEQLHYTCRGLLCKDVSTLSIIARLMPAGFAQVVSINLSHNSIGDAGAQALGGAMASGAPSLRKLQLHENRIESPGLVAIADAMRPGGAPGLVFMRVDFNRIDDAGAEALAKAFEANGALELQELNLSSNVIGDSGFTALSEQLQRAPMLRTLTFGSSSGGNLIGDAGAAALAAALAASGVRPNGALSINLKNNKLSPEGEAALAETLGPDDKSHDIAVSFRSRLSLTRSTRATSGAPAAVHEETAEEVLAA
jgi:hypothetical protein